MKIIATILFFAAAILAGGADKLFDDNLATNAVAVLRVHKTHDWPLPKYPFTGYHIHVYEVFKNESHENLKHDMRVNGFKGQDGVPSGECTIYITRYDVAKGRFDKANGTIWMLVGGNATNGVSHIDSNATFR